MNEKLAQAREGRVYASAGMVLRDAEVTGTRHRYLEGRACPYGVTTDTGWYTETLARGLFAKSIQEGAKGLPLLLFHDSKSLDAIVGVAESWDERDDGLHGVWRLSDADHAQRAARMAADGLLGYMSVGFMPIRSTSAWDDEENLSILRTEARLLEVSLTPTPAYQDAQVTKVRTAEVLMSRAVSGREVAGWKTYLEKARAQTL